MYEQINRFSSEDPHRLWIVVAGRAMPYTEALRWRRVLWGHRKLLPLLSFLLIGVFVLELFSLLATGDLQWYDALVAVIIVAGAAAIGGVAIGKALLLPQKNEMMRFAAYAADMKYQQSGIRIGFYGDRITFTSVRGVQTVPFCDVERCVETQDGFALFNGSQWFIIRSADLIPFDANIIREYLEARLAASVIDRVAFAKPHLFEPLPIPHLEESPASLVTAEIPFKKTVFYKKNCRRKQNLLSLVAVSMALIAGVIVPCYVPSVTEYFLLDVAVFCACFAAAAWLLAVGALALYRRKPTGETAVVSFEPDGLRITADGITQFCVKERLLLIPEKLGVCVRFLNGETLFIPFSAATNEWQLRALAGAPNCAEQ